LARRAAETAYQFKYPHLGNDSACGETNIQFPRDIMQGGGVILNQLGRMYRISAFADDSTVVKMMGDAIPEPLEQDLQFEFKAHLDNTVAAILLLRLTWHASG